MNILEENVSFLNIFNENFKLSTEELLILSARLYTGK